MTSWPDWCSPDWNSWALTAGCWMVRDTIVVFSYMCRMHMIVLHLSALLCCRNIFNSCLEKIWWRLGNLVPATPQIRLAGPGPASKSSELSSCSRLWDRCWQLTVFRLKKSNKISNKVFLFMSKSHSLYMFQFSPSVAKLPVLVENENSGWSCYLSI